MKIVATLVKGRDLKPGDLFSTVGPAELAPDMDLPVYRIEVKR